MILYAGVTTVSIRWCNGIPLPEVGARIAAVHDNFLKQCNTSAQDLTVLLTLLAGEKPGGGSFPVTLTLE